MAFGSVNTPGAGYLGLTTRLASLERAVDGAEKLAGGADPTSSTAARVGQIYVNTATGEEWLCTAVAADGKTAWEKRTIQRIQIFAAGTSVPERTDILWVDTTPVTGGLKYHDGSAWVHVPTTAV